MAKIGIGKQHAKWQAANASYGYYPEVKEAGDSKAVKLCPKGALKAKGAKATLADPLKCDLCDACSEGGMKIEGSPTKFIFKVESVSGLEPAYIVSKAAEILQEKATEFKKELSKL